MHGLDPERQRILKATWIVLARSGFEGFKVQLVLREAGVSARTFYRHFADKDALFRPSGPGGPPNLWASPG